MNINKKQALEKLEQLRVEFAKKGKELEDIINAPDKKDWRNVKSFEDACEFLGDNNLYLINLWQNAKLTDSQIAGLKLEYCIKAINEGWKFDWKNSSQDKWYNVFEHKDSGAFGFVDSGCYCYYSDSSVVYYESKEKAKFGAKHFIEYYKIWMS